MSGILQGEDVRVLVELGFVALSAGLVREAETIFTGVRAARPNDEAGPLGLAMTAMARGELGQAIGLLRSLPPSDAALTYLGLALARDGQATEARRILAEVLETADGTPFADVAAGALAEFKLQGA